MAFMRYGAAVKKTRISLGDWSDVRRAAGERAAFEANEKALRLGKFSPDNFLLTHATIISSVDVEANDFYITPRTTKYVNSNHDAWERQLLLATYHTFCGAENYLEHVQIPSLSKGKILDAVARNLGDTVYVDILVATNRKHRDLVAKIESGELQGLSMGCQVAYTLCSRCGNKAADEVELCPHIRYGKGDLFIDEKGVERKIAELCGHRTDPDSVIFIESSWVANPAFVGAVARSFIKSGVAAQQLAAGLERVGPRHHLVQGLRKVAFRVAEKPHRTMLPDTGPKFRGPRRFDDPMPDVDKPRKPEDEEGNRNDNLIIQKKVWVARLKQALNLNTSISDDSLFPYKKFIAVGKRRGWAALKGQMNQRQFLTAVVLSDRVNGHKGFTPRLAKILEAVGPLKLYESTDSFLERCGGLLQRPLVGAEQRMLVFYGGLMADFPESQRVVTV